MKAVVRFGRLVEEVGGPPVWPGTCRSSVDDPHRPSNDRSYRRLGNASRRRGMHPRVDPKNGRRKGRRRRRRRDRMRIAYTARGAIDERPRTRLPLLILGLVLLGLGRAPAHAQSVRFAVIGDYGGATQAELAGANMVHRWNPYFRITVADINYVY